MLFQKVQAFFLKTENFDKNFSSREYTCCSFKRSTGARKMRTTGFFRRPRFSRLVIRVVFQASAQQSKYGRRKLLIKTAFRSIAAACCQYRSALR